MSELRNRSKTKQQGSRHSTYGAGASHIYCPFKVARDAIQFEIEQAAKNQNSGKICLSAISDTKNGKDPSFRGTNDTTAVTPVLDIINDEVERMSAMIEGERRTLESSARSLLQTIDARLAMKKPAEMEEEEVETLRKVLDEFVDSAEIISEKTLKLNRYTKSNMDVLKQLAMQADLTLSTSIHAFIVPKLNSPPWSTGDGIIITILSDVNETLRNAYKALDERAAEHDGAAKWVAPSSFERKTHKYFVSPDKLSNVLHAVVQKAPLLVYGRSGRLTPKDKSLRVSDNNNDGGDFLWDNLVTPITSIYFDSPDMYLYHKRIAREEGAKLFRIRWYGTKPSGNDLVFMELKTHHEKWVNSKSVKERVNIREKDVKEFLARGGDKWDISRAQAMVSAANSKIDEKALAKQSALLLEMHTLVHEKDLRPCVRTTYMRAAFQSASNNNLRLTIDRSITMVDETHNTSDDWCLSDASQIEMHSITKLPCAIFEVKIGGDDDEASEFVDDLISDGTINDGHKFSKFLTGGAAFNKVKIMPYWAELDAMSIVFDTDGSKQGGARPTMENFASALSTRVIAKPATVAAAAAVTTSTPPAPKNIAPLEMESSKPPDNDKNKSSFFIEAPFSCCPWMNKGPKTASRDPARVEPKSYFANERTYIQWVSTSTMIYALAQILLTSGSTDGYVSGMIITVLSLLMIVYALYLYFKRLRLLQSRSHTGYVERLGPLTLGCALIVAVSISLSYTSIPPKTTPPTKAIVADKDVCVKHGIVGVPAMAFQPSDIVVEDDGTAEPLLLVPSLATITALPLVLTGEGRVNDTAAASAGVEVILTENGENFEGLTYVKDTIYAISENNKGSGKLFALQWDSSSGTKTLSIVDSWKIDSPGAEGIAYLPTSANGKPKLLIAADLLVLDALIDVNRRGEIHVYEIPTSDDSGSTLQPIYKINTDLIGYGLMDSKISALQFFDNVLYALHDNSNKLRGWDLNTATIVAEWNTPNVTGGFNNQWEGFHFERSGDSSTSDGNFDRNLRGLHQESSSSQIMLHMALDTPPQVWTIAATESVSGDPQSITLPKCSGMEKMAFTSPSL